MSNVNFIPGSNNVPRLSFAEFLSEKVRRLEESHKKLRLKYLDDSKELELLKENLLKYDGYISHMKQMLSEWELYNKDTAKLRQLESETKQQVEQKEEINNTEKPNKKRK